MINIRCIGYISVFGRKGTVKAMDEKKKEVLDELSGELPDDMVDEVSGGEVFYLTPEPDPVPEPAPATPPRREYHPDPFPIEIIG